nr:hypothetical protein [Suaeda aralocaspica]
MALAKDHQTPSCAFFGNMLEPNSSLQFPHISPYGFDGYNQKHNGDGLGSPSSNKMSQVMMSSSPPLSSSSSATSSNGGFVIHHPHTSNYQPNEEANSLINFKAGYESFMHSGGSLLSFNQEDSRNYPSNDNIHFPMWEGGSTTSSMSHDHLKLMKNSGSNMRLLEEANCLQSASGGGGGGGSYQEEANEWLYVEAITEPPQESGTQQTCFNKRPHTVEENMQASKKQCTTSASKKPTKPKSSTSKDPQSIAAKNRRERISERLKILQDLVPNGSKVDLVTMLEKAIGYVKFLQLQVKVLATDEFWPVAGGKAPDISQVREAIDAILSSQRSEGTTTS